MNFLIFGAGKNQIPLIKISYLKENNNFIIHNKKNTLAKNFSQKIFKGSVYDRNDVIKICKTLKKQKIIIDDIICRTTGPSILSASYVSNFFDINRISIRLAKCIYSKSHFSKILKKNNIPFIANRSLEIENNIYLTRFPPFILILGKKSHIF